VKPTNKQASMHAPRFGTQSN